MPSQGRFAKKESFMFQDDKGNLIPHVALVVVEGMWDSQNQRYVDPPQVGSGYGTVRPERVAELVGIKKP